MGGATSACCAPGIEGAEASVKAATKGSEKKDDVNKLIADAEQWMKWDKNEKNRAEIAKIVASKDVTELKARFGTRIAFGTAGLRGPMRAGPSSMNDLIIIQTTQGFYEYLRQHDPMLENHGVVIGYDCRHNSRRFAELAAAIFISKGVTVYLFGDICPTPLVPFTVNEKMASAGIMVTASHNPKNDNGYKVYWSNGCQINSPHDKGIATCIASTLEPWDIDTEKLLESELNIDPRDTCGEAYLSAATKQLCHYKNENKMSPFKITYTAMHGVGHEWCTRLFLKFGLNPYIPVENQVLPDPEFPTVVFPNPEEGAGALKCAMQTADANGSTLILANDPDADRLAVAEKGPNGWKIYNGNEIGALLGNWALFCEKRFNHSFRPAQSAMVGTAVSSKMLEAMCKAEGIQYRETHTGFKWIGNVADELQKKENIRCLFGYEEAIGFMIGDISLDKDGVRAAAVFAEMAIFLNIVKGKTCLEHLYDLYDRYGYHCIQTNYFFCYDPDVMKQVFDEVRHGGEYVKEVGGHEVVRVRDLTLGYDSGTPNKKPEMPVTPGTQMITLWFKNGCCASIRGSGTEPKLKYYVEVKGDVGDKDYAKVEALHAQMVKVIADDVLRPEKWKLVKPKH